MTARTPAYLKGRFEQGDVPVGADYEDLMDSFVNFATSAEQTLDSNLKTTKKLVAATVSATSITAASATFTNLITPTLNASTVSAASLTANNANINTVSAGTLTAATLNVTTASAAVLRANTVSADSINVSGNVIFGSFDISAVSTTQASAVVLNGTTNFIIYADGDNTAVRLPASVRGREQRIINAASTTIKLYPSVSGRFLVTAVNASLNLPADKTALVFHKGDDRYGVIIGGF